MNAEKITNINEALGQPLDPALVSKRKLFSGRNEEVEYIAGNNAIDQANRIFGPLGWSYTVSDQRIENVSRVNISTGEIQRVDRICFATVQVVITEGPTREDTGSCGVGKNREGHETPDGLEMARKGAVTDGLKRALRTFGAQFGNSLYDDTPTPAVEQTAAAAPAPAHAPATTPAAAHPATPIEGGALSDEELIQLITQRASAKGWTVKDVSESTQARAGKPLMELERPMLERVLGGISQWPDKAPE